MRLVELLVRRMPGIDEPFRLAEDELADGLHVVHGPNGIGKSTLCRAAHALLWPATVEGGAISVEARFEHGGSLWFARREGGHVEWQRDGAPGPAPEVPDVHLARCFLVTVDDLYDRSDTAGKDGRWFAERVLQEMAGGFDVHAVRRALFEPGVLHGRTELRALEEARRLVLQRERDQEHVLNEERELSGLERERDQARAAAGELAALEAATERLAVRARLALARSAVEELPAATARMSGDEGRRLEELDERLESLRGKLRELEGQERAARGRLAASALDSALPPEVLEEQRERLDELRERERELRGAHERRDAALGRLEGARARLGASADLDGLATAGEVDLEAIERLVRDVQVLDRDRDALQAKLRALGEAQEATADGDVLAAAVRALNGWLRTPEPATRRPSPWAWVAIALSAAIALGLGALLHPAGFALLLAPLSMAWVLVRPRPPHDPRAVFVDEFARTRSTPPAAWEPRAVEQRLDELERERARLRALEEVTGQRRELQQGLERLEQRADELADRREGLRQRLGVEISASDLALADLAAALSELRRADADRRAAEGAAHAHERERAALHDVLCAFAVRHGEQAGEDSAALARALASLERRSLAADKALGALEQIARSRDEGTGELARLDQARRALFEALDLEVGDRAGLERLAEQRALRQEAERELTEVRGELRGLEARLAGHAALDELEAARIESRLEQARVEAARLDDLTARIAGIERGVRDAQASSDLEEARAAEELALARLEDAREAALRAEAGRLLLEQVEREHERLSRPAVLSRAGELFAAFTHHRYGLDVVQVEGAAALRASETERPGVGLEPEQLSSGTRAQLLLAVRLAFAGQAERGLRLPLFVDDALATSDPDRVRAIAASLLEIARDEQRQVIVLTKDEGDVALLRSVAGGTSLRVIDLAALRRRQGAETSRERLELPPERRVPAPEGDDGPAYARRLEVPPLDPWRALGEAHLYHLLPDDLALLHRLLTWGLERVGPLRAMLASGSSISLGSEERGRLAAWIDLAQGVHASWRIGRGTPLTTDALRACPAISETFLERVEDLAAELGWDARRLVDALREGQVKGFRSGKADEAEAWLEARGHIAPDDPLTQDAAWARLLMELEELGTAARPTPEILRRRFDFLWRRFEEGAG